MRSTHRQRFALDAGESREPFAQRVQMQELRLQLAKTRGHQLQVVVHVLLGPVCFLFLCKDALPRVENSLTGGKRRKGCRRRDDEGNEREARDRQMARHNGDCPRCLEVAGNKNDLH